MPLIYYNGDIFTVDAEAITNPINTVGVMGKGLALQFKERYPHNFDLYLTACKNGQIKIGQMFVVSTGNVNNPKWIINFPTKMHWKDPSRLEWIRLGLIDLVQTIQVYKINSIAIPRLGCGLGGLNWEDVRTLFELFLGKLPIQVIAVQ